MSEFGLWSVAPPLVAIVLAIVTRKAVLSLFLGIWAGALVFTDGILTGALELVQTFEWIGAAVGESVFHVQIIIFTLFLGSAVAMIWRLGGSHAVQEWAVSRIDSQRKVGFTLALLLGSFAMVVSTYILGLVYGQLSVRSSLRWKRGSLLQKS